MRRVIASVVIFLAVLAALPASAADAPSVPTVAILYFDYQGKTDELGMLRKGLAQMLVSDLAGGPSFAVVERERLEEVLAEQKLSRSASFDAATAARIGRLLGARFLVLGGFFDLAGTLRVDARVVEVETGKVVKSVGAGGTLDDFLAVEQKVSSDLRAILEARLPPPAAAPRRVAPPKPPARLPASTATRYSRALDAKDRGDRDAARAGLTAVLKEQPDFVLASIELDRLVR